MGAAAVTTPIVAAPAFRMRVNGLPIPQGSKIPFIAKGKAMLRDDNAPKLRPWRKAITKAAQVALFGRFDWQPLDGPLRCALLFAFPRPPSHPKRRRTWPTGKGEQGDIDKLVRAILDALSDAKVWTDDARVVELHALKDWCGWGPARMLTVPGVVIRVWRIHEEPPTSGQIPLLPQSEGTA